MAKVATIDGAKIMMYANDHPPPHFHVLFAEHRAVVDIRTLKLIKGEMPRSKLRAILKWAQSRRAKLLDAWDITQTHGIPERIR